MNILYISNLPGGSHTGPTYSVPKQIEAQSKIDNVFWYNTKKIGHKSWETFDFYHNLNEFPTGKIKNLPKPFNKPDLIIVEGFYSTLKNKIFFEIFFSKIPYIIVPRGELTKMAQMKKGLKKKIANLFICKKFAKKALAIEYLTEQEKIDAGDSWNKKSIVIPNGIVIPTESKINFTRDGIICTFIGRIEPYQKGLDLLVKAVQRMGKKITENNIKFNLYGSDKEGKLNGLKDTIKVNNLHDVISLSNGVYDEDKRRVLLETDVFIMTSRFEGHPMALIEALSLGLPVFITKGTNMKKEVEELNAGWTAKTTVEDIVEAFENMIKDKNTLIQKSENAKKLAKLYEWNKIAEKSHTIYQKLLYKNKGVK